MKKLLAKCEFPLLNVNIGKLWEGAEIACSTADKILESADELILFQDHLRKQRPQFRKLIKRIPMIDTISLGELLDLFDS